MMSALPTRDDSVMQTLNIVTQIMKTGLVTSRHSLRVLFSFTKCLTQQIFKTPSFLEGKPIIAALISSFSLLGIHVLFTGGS